MDNSQIRKCLASPPVWLCLRLIIVMTSIAIYWCATGTYNDIHPVASFGRYSINLTRYLTVNKIDFLLPKVVPVLNTTVTKNLTGAAPADCLPQLRFAEELPVTALYSYPGSGNTWLRYLLQLATGIYTGAQTNDHYLKEHGFPGEGRTNGSVLAVKTHQIDKDTQAKFDRAIMIIREPYAAALAEFNRREGGHTGYSNKTMKEDDIVKQVRLWHYSNMLWILYFPRPLHVVYYDALRVDVVKEMTKLLHFLDQEILPNQLQCIAENSEGEFRRKSAKKAVSTHYSQYLMDFVNDCVSRVPGYLEERKASGFELSI